MHSCKFVVKKTLFVGFYVDKILKWCYNYLCINIHIPHNENYVVDFFFDRFNIAKVLISEFVFCVFHPFPLYKFSLCLRYYVREYQQGGQYPFAGYNKCARKDDGGCGGRPSSPTHSPPYIVFSYHSKYSIYQADCRSSSRTRHRFLFFVL